MLFFIYIWHVYFQHESLYISHFTLYPLPSTILCILYNIISIYSPHTTLVFYNRAMLYSTHHIHCLIFSYQLQTISLSVCLLRGRRHLAQYSYIAFLPYLGFSALQRPYNRLPVYLEREIRITLLYVREYPFGTLTANFSATILPNIFILIFCIPLIFVHFTYPQLSRIFTQYKISSDKPATPHNNTSLQQLIIFLLPYIASYGLIFALQKHAHILIITVCKNRCKLL